MEEYNKCITTNEEQKHYDLLVEKMSGKSTVTQIKPGC